MKFNIENNNLGKFLTYEESRKIAYDLLQKYKSQIQANIGADVEKLGVLVYEDYQDSIDSFLKRISKEEKEHYSGHGVTRHDELENLAGGISIMANESIVGSAGSLKGEAYGAWTKGADFLVVSKKDKPLFKLDENNNLTPVKSGGNAVDIGAIIVNTHFYPMFEEFKKMFPEVNIIKANEIPQYFGKEEIKS